MIATAGSVYGSQNVQFNPGPPPTLGVGVGGGIGGGLGARINLKKVFLFGALGALAGVFLPFIPGGAIGGALIGAGVGLLLK